jgi:hypothetical protein
MDRVSYSLSGVVVVVLCPSVTAIAIVSSSRAVSEHDVMCFGTLNRAAPLKSRGLHRRHLSLVLLTLYFAPIIFSDSQLEYHQTVSGSTRNGLPRSTGIFNGIYGQLL